MKIFKLDQKGITLPFALMVGIAVTMLIMSLTKSVRFSAHETAYFGTMDKVYRLAESGLSEAIGNLTNDPDSYLNGGALQGAAVSFDNGTFQNYVTTSAVELGAYYITTVASVTIGGRTYSSKLHTHARVSNATEYFWAVNGLLILAPGTDASLGKVYAADLDFRTDPAKTTKVLSAEFLTSLSPTKASGLYVAQGAGTGGDIEVAEPTAGPDTNEPVQLIAPITFPQVLDGDTANYKDLANIDGVDPHQKCDFTVDSETVNGPNEIHIYPPGYGGPPHNDDEYFVEGGHTADLEDHVYFCPGDVTIGTPPGTTTYIHGQVIIFATGTIFITGGITRFTQDDTQLPDDAAFNLTPGTSTAHQLIFITPGDVRVRNTFHPNDGNNYTQVIQAAIIAPYGRVSSEPYPSPPPLAAHAHTLLALDFTGAMILNEIENYPTDNFGSVFQGNLGGGLSRRYTYMQSLKDNPPPFLPSIVEIYFSLEETTTNVKIF